MEEKYAVDPTIAESYNLSNSSSNHHGETVSTGKHKLFSKETLLNYFPRYKLKRSGIEVTSIEEGHFLLNDVLFRRYIYR